MTLTVTSDPKRAGGGYARLRLPAGSVKTPAVAVSVYGLFRERYLGPGEWQPTPSYFGPYDVETLESGAHALTIGPEIVNAMEEFMALRFDIGGYSADVTWPDVIQPAPGAPGFGRVLTAQEVDAVAKGTLTGTVAQPTKPAPAPKPPEPAPEKVVIGGEPPPPPPPPPPPRPSWLLTLLVVLAIVAAAAAYLIYQPDEPLPLEPPVPPACGEPGAEACDPPPPVDIPECSAATALAQADGPSAAIRALLSDQADGRCTGDINADLSLFVLQDAARAGSAEALLLFGHLYNSDITDPLFEEQMGVVLTDDPAQALDYYSRAAEAGSDQAGPAIARICEAIANETDMLVVQARRDFCP